jgi:hypothetical protein
MPQLWKSLLQPSEKNPTEMVDENKLISLMENFKGQKFQWVKTQRPEQLGKIVNCRMIEPRGDRFFAVFDDGSSIDTNQLNTSLMMLHGDMEPLSKAEVESISGIKRPAPTPKQPNVYPNAVQPEIAQPTAQPMNSAPKATAAPPKPNMFELFNSEPTQLNISLSVKLPEKKLLKMMYTSAENKDEFLAELADYLQKMINKEVITKSMADLLAPPSPRKESNRPVVNLTEVDGSK